MKKKALSLALALMMCLGLTVPALAAGTDLPDWYFLFAIFKNVDADCKGRDGKATHTKYTMSQDEVDVAKVYAQDFEEYMDQLGLMRAHVDVVEIDTTVTKLKESTHGSYLDSEQTALLLKGKVDLDRYDHVTCMISLGVSTAYGGITGSEFENGTGHSCINFTDREHCLSFWADYPWRAGWPVHEFLHFMERMNRKYGKEFSLHDIMQNFYERVNGDFEECYTDILLNRARGTAGTGVYPAVWQIPPHVVRTLRETTREVTIPSDMSVIGEKAFQFYSNLSDVDIHSGVTEIGVAAFEWCTSLTEVEIPSGVISIGDWAFQGCSSLTKVSIPASVANIGRVAFYHTGLTDVYYGGTKAQWKAIQIGEYNESLTQAAIHYADDAPQDPPAVTAEDIPASGTAYASTQTVTVDGKAVEFQMYALKDANGNGTNYIKLRDLAYVLNGTQAQFAVGYDGTISLTTGRSYTAAGGEMTTPFSGDRSYTGGIQTVKVDGGDVAMTAITLLDGNGGGYNYFKLRDLGRALGFNVGWSAEQGISIETDEPYPE